MTRPPARPALTGLRPLDLAPLPPVLATPPGDVADVVARARAAFPAWAALPLEDREARLDAAARRMVARRGEVVALLAAEVGKGHAEALFGEALAPLDQLRQWRPIVRAHLRRRRIALPRLAFPGKRAFVDVVPRGVIAVITPWNYPLATFLRPVLPALLTGNAVVLKPSEHAPRTALWFAESLASFLPDGLVGLVLGGADHGRAVVGSDVDAVCFTGSVAAGRDVARRCGERLVPASLELGGKDAAIVLADCDLDRTLAGITTWALHNAGQDCGAIERVYVEEAIADAFVGRLADAWRRLRVADRLGEGDVAPLATEAQLAVVTRHVDDARRRGAVVRCGGVRVGAGLGYAPTVLDRCTDEMDVVREETFGPVVAIRRVAHADEAVERANASAYGLGASVWTRDLARGRAIAERLRCGVLHVNNHALSGAVVALPWTGTGASGGGIANGPHALATFTRPRSLLVDAAAAPDPFWMPYDGDLVDLGERVGRLQTGDLGAALRLPALAARRRRTLREFFAPRPTDGSSL
ncbi:MAG: aldehyde dehydrogenase family protein [Planctomycetia bacterium]|nr:aldehyde dehydrogenase family protein [Planctomycetia bacterium]